MKLKQEKAVHEQTTSPQSAALSSITNQSSQEANFFDKFSIVNLRNKGVSQIGLGLTFTKMVVEAHGGRVYVEDNRPYGAVFTLEI